MAYALYAAAQAAPQTAAETCVTHAIRAYAIRPYGGAVL